MHKMRMMASLILRSGTLLALFLALPGPLQGQELGVLNGRVVTADGSVVWDAEVRVLSLGRRVSVNEAGEFTVDRLPAGSYLVEASSPRFGHSLERFQILAGQTITVLLELDPLFQLDELIISAGSAPASKSSYTG